MKLYIVVDKLPVKAVARQCDYSFAKSEEGLAMLLDSLRSQFETHWIGCTGVFADDDCHVNSARMELDGMDLHPVFLSRHQYEEYHAGYGDGVISPLCHYFGQCDDWNEDFWDYYKEVNRIFCDEICRLVDSDAWVWVLDYHLMLLPGMLRDRMPDLHIGYFHHIPFPDYEMFRMLPERVELLEGLLGSDFIGFQTYDYMRYFIGTVERVLNLDFRLDEVFLGGRVVRLDALPMGIDYDMYDESSRMPAVWNEIKKNKLFFGKHKILLTVARLGYGSGILHCIAGFDLFLQNHPEYHGKVTLSVVILPSNDDLGRYKSLKDEIDKVVGEINGKYRFSNWTPVCCFYHEFPFEKLTAMYFLADVAIMTPLRDGMNLFAKEYVATKQNNPGVLILSETSGAATELSDAILVNPNDEDNIAQAIFSAVEMPYQEQIKRVCSMQDILADHTSSKWVSDFIGEWKESIERNNGIKMKRLTKNTVSQIKHLYRLAKKRLILLDYDGTLVRLCGDAKNAVPTVPLRGLLTRLAEDPKNEVVVYSGRGHHNLEAWLGDVPVDFVAGHGAYYKRKGRWHRNFVDMQWSESVLSILRTFTEHTPNSKLEINETSILWHYGETNDWIGELRSQQLLRSLVSICTQQNLQITQGNKVVEIKNPLYTDVSEIKRMLRKSNYDFVLAIGDDATDDDIFRVLPQTAITVKVGTDSDDSRYDIKQQEDVIPFLEAISYSRSDLAQSRHRRAMTDVVRFFKKLV